MLLIYYFFIVLLSFESPRYYVSSRSLADVPITNTTEIYDETTVTTEIPETSTTATASNAITLDISRFTSPPQRNRSLYDELSADTSYPTFSSSFSTSSVEQVSSEPSEEENKSHESYTSNNSNNLSSLESAFKADENDFKNNVTKEERHRLDEIKIDEQSIKYSSSVNLTLTSTTTTTTTTVAPPTPAASSKKGKYLDLMPPGEDNINASLPNGAEVWALAAMRDMDGTRKATSAKPSSEDYSDVELLSLNNTAKSLLDWTEIARLDNSTESLETTSSSVNDINATIEDPATAENKEVAVSSMLPAATTTAKSIIEDNRLELEHENVEYTAAANKSVIDDEHFNKNRDENSSIELVAPISEKKLEKLEAETTMESITESDEALTTIASEMTTTSFIDSVTDESDGNSEIFKRTITEIPESFSTSTQSPRTTTMTTITEEVPTTTSSVFPTEHLNTNLNARSTMVTKSISIRIATSTAEPTSTVAETTMSSSDEDSTTTAQYDFTVESSSASTIEIMDDDKFKYSTILPEITASATSSSVSPTVHRSVDTTRSERKEEIASTAGEDGGSNVALISIIVSILVFLLLVAGGFIAFKKRKKQLTYGQRCRPVGLDAYSLDNVSVFNSVRRKANALRLSKRSYGNSAFEDPTLQSNVLDYQSLQEFAKNKISIYDEFKEIPQVSVRVEEVPENCEDKNRYANVVPLPETRVHLQRINDDEKSEYINANYVKGPKDNTNYYIATQAPLENTVPDFWRMIWQENSKVIVMVTDLTENGVERCAEYIPASVVVDNSQTFGDFKVTLKSREVKGKYAVSHLHLKNIKTNTWREIVHLWYSWPENGCPTDDSSVIKMLLESRGYLRTSLPEHLDENSNAESNNNVNDKEKLSTLDKTKSLQRVQGPLTVHCSPGTGRTGTLIACDIVLRMLETPPRQIDIPQIVYHVRRGRANAVRTKDQYEFIYQIANSYATKLNSAPTEA